MWNKKNCIMIVGFFLAAAMLAGCGRAESPSGAGQTAGALPDDRSEGIVDEGVIGVTPEDIMRMYGATELPETMPAFTAVDLAGNTVTEEIFADKDLTVINIWGTFCPPCIEEMPELGAWAKEMPDNVQIVGLIIDIQGEEDAEHRELAIAITDKAGAEFVQLIANEDFADILNWVTGVPTTLFVDTEGNIAGEPIVGAYVDGYKQFVEEYLGGEE